MNQFQVRGQLQHVAQQVEQIMGPRLYHLHNRIGSIGWSVQADTLQSYHAETGPMSTVTIRDAKMATFVRLKLAC